MNAGTQRAQLRDRAKLHRQAHVGEDGRDRRRRPAAVPACVGLKSAPPLRMARLRPQQAAEMACLGTRAQDVRTLERVAGDRGKNRRPFWYRYARRHSKQHRTLEEWV